MIIEEIKKIKSGDKDLRKFGLLIGSILILFGLYFWFKDKNYDDFFFFIGGILVLLGIHLPRSLKALYKIWMALGVILGFIVTNVILTVFFYLIVTPFALVAKFARKKFLDQSFKAPVDSYWNNRENKENSRLDMEKQF
ncbi:MAG TPA: SxtJ family membrane protein [Candidatus Paceibacterota bacterium]